MKSKEAIRYLISNFDYVKYIIKNLPDDEVITYKELLDRLKKDKIEINPSSLRYHMSRMKDYKVTINKRTVIGKPTTIQKLKKELKKFGH